MDTESVSKRTRHRHTYTVVAGESLLLSFKFRQPDGTLYIPPAWNVRVVITSGVQVIDTVGLTDDGSGFLTGWFSKTAGRSGETLKFRTERVNQSGTVRLSEVYGFIQIH